MAVAGTTLMCCSLPPPLNSKQSPVAIVIPTKTTLLPLQVTKGEKLQNTLSVSRRDMICLTAQTMSLATFWSAEPAEARISKSDMKRKILEKLQQLREKAGFAKPKNEQGENSSPEPPSGKDENLQGLSPSQKSPEKQVDNLVEAALDQVFTFIP